MNKKTLCHIKHHQFIKRACAFNMVIVMLVKHHNDVIITPEVLSWSKMDAHRSVEAQR